MKPKHYQGYIQILREELIPAMGCTEPIALAYAAARARRLLGQMPQRAEVRASGSVIKNVKSVIVPNTGHMRGTPAACAAGIAAGDPDAELEVLAAISPEQVDQIRRCLEEMEITVLPLEGGPVFDIVVTVYADGHSARVRIAEHHTHVVREERDGEILLDTPVTQGADAHLTDRSCLSVEEIWRFAQALEADDVREILDRQIRCNTAICEEGLRGDYGANIGRTLLNAYGDGAFNRIKAYAAAGSDARMNGCDLPVVINSGSGNQGITCSVPVIVYARHIGAPEDKLYRALALSNLIAIHQKTGIGTLSAYCGAVSAGAPAGAGIAYLDGGDYEDVIHTIVNTLAVTSGMVCDGANASCAAKIAVALDAALFGWVMFRNGQQFYGGDGIVIKGVEATIRNVGRLGREGMRATNEEIVRMMTDEL